MNNSGSGRKISPPVLLAGGGILLAVGFGAGFSIREKTDQRQATTQPIAVAGPQYSGSSLSPAASAPPTATAAPDAMDLTTLRLTRNDTALVSKTHMTPELARTLLAKVKTENKDINERALLCAVILGALSKSGYVGEAWSLIDESPGTVRVMEIGMLFQSDKVPLDTLLAKLAELTDPDDRTNAVRGILMSRPAEIANLDFSEIPLETSEQKHAAFSAIVMAMQQLAEDKDPRASEAILGKVIELARSGKIETRHLSMALDADYGVDPFRKWEILGGFNEGFSPTDAERFRAHGVPNMIRADMDKAMKLLCTDRQSRYPVPILGKAVSTMYQIAPEQANAWITENYSTIDPATGQRLIVSVGQAAIRSGELDTARRWADRLLNPGVKDQLLKQIEAASKPLAEAPH
jgi:hypothetical protein